MAINDGLPKLNLSIKVASNSLAKALISTFKNSRTFFLTIEWVLS
jgi:hypothetical protein